MSLVAGFVSYKSLSLSLTLYPCVIELTCPELINLTWAMCASWHVGKEENPSDHLAAQQLCTPKPM